MKLFSATDSAVDKVWVFLRLGRPRSWPCLSDGMHTDLSNQEIGKTRSPTLAKESQQMNQKPGWNNRRRLNECILAYLSIWSCRWSVGQCGRTASAYPFSKSHIKVRTILAFEDSNYYGGLTRNGMEGWEPVACLEASMKVAVKRRVSTHCPRRCYLEHEKVFHCVSTWWHASCLSCSESE